jgi:hypothetical protein
MTLLLYVGHGPARVSKAVSEKTPTCRSREIRADPDMGPAPRAGLDEVRAETLGRPDSGDPKTRPSVIAGHLRAPEGTG